MYIFITTICPFIFYSYIKTMKYKYSSKYILYTIAILFISICICVIYVYLHSIITEEMYKDIISNNYAFSGLVSWISLCVGTSLGYYYFYSKSNTEKHVRISKIIIDTLDRVLSICKSIHTLTIDLSQRGTKRRKQIRLIVSYGNELYINCETLADLCPMHTEEIEKIIKLYSHINKIISNGDYTISINEKEIFSLLDDVYDAIIKIRKRNIM